MKKRITLTIAMFILTASAFANRSAERVFDLINSEKIRLLSAEFAFDNFYLAGLRPSKIQNWDNSTRFDLTYRNVNNYSACVVIAKVRDVVEDVETTILSNSCVNNSN